jgi:hypothetical protein
MMMNCRFQGRAIVRRLVADPYHRGLGSIPPKTCGGQSSAGKGFTPRTSVFAYQYHSTNTPYSFASEYYYCNTRRTRRRSLGTFKQSNAVSDIRNHCTQKYFHAFFTGFKYQKHFNYNIQGKKKRIYNENKIRTFMKVCWSQLIYPLGDIDLLTKSIADYVTAHSMCRIVLFYFDTYFLFYIKRMFCYMSLWLLHAYLIGV